ncbi:MAG: phosphatase PAP2 family protein [Prevotellaceae bacterium]|jgi:membrane-associated phospholipid phosphatase|nr:phosphatase PAP2 family protein [Prevotellaceae bacterium]
MRAFLKRFNSAELLTFIYIFLTLVYILVFFGKIENPYCLLFYRAVFSAALLLTMFVSEIFDNGFTGFIRYLLPFSMIVYWYPETYSLGHAGSETLPGGITVSNIDHVFEHADRLLFGCSPAMEFSKAFPQAWVSEIMYFGYFSYYFIFLFSFAYFFFVKPACAEKVMFCCLCSFLIFYVIFIFVPVAGPQFYYSAPDSQVPDGYFFASLMRGIQDAGEKPTGAFPSSHVGLTIIIMFLLFRHARKYFYAILPVAIVLSASTVYIKAHYLTDVIAAFVAAPLVFMSSRRIFVLFNRLDLRRISSRNN